MTKSNYSRSNELNFLRGVAGPTPPASIYVGLWNGDPTAAGTGGTEVTTTVRAAGRVVPTYGTASTAGSSISNTAIIDFGNAAGATTVTHWAVWDAATGGNMLRFGPMTAGSTAVAAGAPCTFPIAALVFGST